MINLEDAFVVFYAGTPLERVALRGVSFSAQDGEVVSIVGNSGSGRSTLLKFLAGHLPLTFGRLWYNNDDITSQTLQERARLVSGVFFDHNMCTAGNLTVLENLAVASMHNRNRSFLRPAIDSSMRDKFYDQLKNLNFMDMETLLDEKVDNLPKPYKQVLGLMIAVTKGTKILVIDEHSTGLDVDASKALLETTNKIIRSKKITTFMVVNDPEFSLNKADRVLVLNYGQVVAAFSGEEKKRLKLEELFSFYNKLPKLSVKRKIPMM